MVLRCLGMPVHVLLAQAFIQFVISGMPDVAERIAQAQGQPIFRPEDIPAMVTQRALSQKPEDTHDDLDFSYLVKLRTEKSASSHCDGVLISKYSVITTARCTLSSIHFVMVRNPETLEVDAHEVEQVVVHPRNVPGTFQYDIAIIQLSEAVESTTPISAEFAAVDHDDNRTMFSVANWALPQDFDYNPIHSIQLEKLAHMNEKVCQEQVSQVIPEFIIDSSMICSQPRSSEGFLLGHGGGPLLADVAERHRPSTPKYALIGLESWSPLCQNPKALKVFVNLVDPEIQDFLSKFTNEDEGSDDENSGNQYFFISWAVVLLTECWMALSVIF